MKVDLVTWCEQYVRSRDAMERKLKTLERKGESVVATYKDKTVTFLSQPSLDEKHIPADGHVTIVCLQNQENFNTLVTHFAAYARNPNLTIMFLNPQLNEKWSLKPAVHAAVADKASLKTGLQTLYQTVPAL
jgi:hypothetical protein